MRGSIDWRDKMDVEKLKQKIKALTSKLEKEEIKLSKATPTKPLISDESDYNSKKKELIHKYTYFCSYCGEPIRKNSKKHMCGQVHDWSEIN